MAVSAFQKVLNRLFQQFTRQWGREPQTPKEWMDLQNEAVQFFNKTKGVPPGPAKPPFQGWNPKVIQGGKGIESLLKSGDVKKGVAPKTKAKTLTDKKERHILFRDAEEDIARIKRENKQAVKDFEKKHGKKTVEDFRDEGDWDPGGFAGGGLVKKFIERLFIKASNDIRQGKGKWKGLTQDQWIKQHDDLTKMMKKWEWGGKKKLPEGAEQYLGMNDLQIARAVKQAEKQVGDEALMQKAYDEIKGGSGFTDDYKYDADILAEEYARQHGKVYADLPEDQISIYYDPALKRVSQDLKARMDAKKALKDVEEKVELQMFDTEGRKPNAEGGRQDFIFGGSAGLRALLKRLKGGRKRVFPSPPQGIKKFMSQADTDYIDDLKLQQLETILRAAKIDKESLAHSFKVKKMNDPGLDFLLGKLDEAGLKAKNLDKYTDIDKDIMDIEMMIKNYSDKKLKRKTHESGGLAYMLGEPTYMKSAGGKVGHGPWTTGQTPQGPQDRPDMPQPQVGGGGGRPDPMKAPRLPSVAPRNMDPQVMQQQRMQQAMMQQGIPQGIPRVGMMYGGDPGFAFEYGGSWADWHDQHRNAMPIEDYIQTKLPKERLPFRENFSLGGFNKGRRAFLKWLAGITGSGIAGASGLLKFGSKAAPKAVKEVTETIARDADGMPTYVTDLIKVVKAKGTKDIIEGFKRSDYSTVHTYKGVEVIEDGAGNIKIKSDKSGVATDPYTGKSHEGISQENHIQIEKGGMNVKDEGLDTQKSFQEPDEYFEGTVYPDMDGKMKDLEEGLDKEVHEFFKEIADEIKDIRPKKASGGLAHMLGE